MSVTLIHFSSFFFWWMRLGFAGLDTVDLSVTPLIWWGRLKQGKKWGRLFDASRLVLAPALAASLLLGCIAQQNAFPGSRLVGASPVRVLSPWRAKRWKCSGQRHTSANWQTASWKPGPLSLSSRHSFLCYQSWFGAQRGKFHPPIHRLAIDGDFIPWVHPTLLSPSPLVSTERTQGILDG